jgi:hypothetical protein
LIERSAGDFVLAGVVGGVLQTLPGMFSTCAAMFVARWAGSYVGLLQFLAFG